MLAHIQKWWMAHITLVAAIVTFISPSIQNFISTHAQYALVVGAVWAYILKASKSPVATAVVLTLALVLALAWCPASYAQAPAELPGYNVSISGGYSLVASAQNNNGFFSSVAVPMWTSTTVNTFNIAARADYFSITKPSTYVVTAGPEFRYQFSKSNFMNGTVFQPFANFGAGAARSSCVSDETCPAGADTNAHFAFKIGGGLDRPVSSSVVLRLFEVDYIRSTIFPTGSVTVSNFAQITSGLSIRF